MSWDIFANEWAVDLLRRHVASGEVRHAYLFTGPPGIGRRTLALRFAQAINCPQPIEPGVPCGICRICQQTARMQQPDLSIVQREEDASLIKVEQVRNLQHSLSLSPYEARYRIALLLNFEQATPSTQNGLLKTLEEAPQQVVLLLTAESSESLLPTIVSRCEVLRLRPAAIAPLEIGLAERWGYPADEAHLLAHLSGGRTGYAIHLHDHPELLAQREDWLLDIGDLLCQPVRLRFAWVEKNHRRPEKNELRLIFQVWLSFWRDLLLCAAASSAPLTNVDHTDDIRRLAQHITPPEVLAAVASLEQGLARLDANGNGRLVLENLLLDWPQVQP